MQSEKHSPGWRGKLSTLCGALLVAWGFYVISFAEYALSGAPRGSLRGFLLPYTGLGVCRFFQGVAFGIVMVALGMFLGERLRASKALSADVTKLAVAAARRVRDLLDLLMYSRPDREDRL
ncbi:MAG: hypothetical protein R6X33_07710 [Candidatus Brocadiia bacterium]